jgi:hypothetical protein
MRGLVILRVHVITTIVRLVRPRGLRAVVAESVLSKHQLLILNRSRQRAPNLLAVDRLLFSPKQGTKLGPKGPTTDLIGAVVKMKQRSPTWG